VILNSHDNTITVKTFSADQIEEATKLYLELEKEHYRDININVVLVNSGNIKKLEASYPNYFMDTNALVEQLSKIVIGKFLS
jgi:ssRNA-specific RNase YbeY (16S rRNA maturation enzyme)